MAHKRDLCQPLSPEGCWIKYRLNLKDIRLEAVAQKARRSVSLVSEVISGVKNSEAVGAALAEALGFGTYQALMEKARKEAKRRAA